jgi:hypothetical protein
VDTYHSEGEGEVNKLKRIWRAFKAGFWAAWLEVPPRWAKNQLTVHISCDTTEFDDEISRVIRRLEEVQRMEAFKWRDDLQ